MCGGPGTLPSSTHEAAVVRVGTQDSSRYVLGPSHPNCSRKGLELIEVSQDTLPEGWKSQWLCSPTQLGSPGDTAPWRTHTAH